MSAALTKSGRRRGRPMAEVSGEDQIVLARRQRNREAQTIFRQRRQAADAAQAQRIKQLEDVVEEFSGLLCSLADQVVTTEGTALIQHHPALVHSLGSIMDRAASLAKVAVSDEETNTADHRPVSVPPIKSEDVVMAGDRPDFLDSALLESSSGNTRSSRSRSAQNNTNTNIDNALDDTFNDITPETTLFPFLFPPSSRMTATHPSTSIQDFNPFMIRSLYECWPPVPPVCYDLTQPAPIAKPPSSAFLSRLLEASVLGGYDNLLQMTSEVNRVFCFALRVATREEMLFRMRWMLGPGKTEMHRASDTPLDPSFGIPEMPGLIGVGWMKGQESDVRQWMSPELIPSSFISALGVQKQLESLGSRLIDDDTLEIKFWQEPTHSTPSTGSGMTPSSADGDAKAARASSRRQNGNTQASQYGHPDSDPAPQNLSGQNETQLMAMHVSVSLLVANLAATAVVFVKGPGYPRSELGRIINASTTSVQPVKSSP